MMRKSRARRLTGLVCTSRQDGHDSGSAGLDECGHEEQLRREDAQRMGGGIVTAGNAAASIVDH
jgi:hypothetical protein